VDLVSGRIPFGPRIDAGDPGIDELGEDDKLIEAQTARSELTLPHPPILAKDIQGFFDRMCRSKNPWMLHAPPIDWTDQLCGSSTCMSELHVGPIRHTHGSV